MPPYALPAQATVSGIKSQSSKGGALSNANELRFDDKKGSEYIWFQAEKDFHRLVKHDAFSTVKSDSWTDITKNSAHKIGE
ncbi:bacteriophage T4 gp5 trimerization domain-containing protein, partial [Roseateles sp. GG27B]